VRRGREVRVPHSQVNDVVSFPPGLHLQVIDDGKDVGRKSLDAIKFFHADPLKKKNLRPRFPC